MLQPTSEFATRPSRSRATSGSEGLMPPTCSTRGKRQNFATGPSRELRQAIQGLNLINEQQGPCRAHDSSGARVARELLDNIADCADGAHVPTGRHRIMARLGWDDHDISPRFQVDWQHGFLPPTRVFVSPGYHSSERVDTCVWFNAALTEEHGTIAQPPQVEGAQSHPPRSSYSSSTAVQGQQYARHHPSGLAWWLGKAGLGHDGVKLELLVCAFRTE